MLGLWLQSLAKRFLTQEVDQTAQEIQGGERGKGEKKKKKKKKNKLKA